jgi:hypothetical protein
MKKGIKIGSRVRLLEQVNMTNITYEIGHVFTIFGSTERGWDLIDDNGNKLYETRFVKMEHYNILEERKEKIAKIKNNIINGRT